MGLVEAIEKNAFHYIEIFSRAVDKVMPQSRKAPKYVKIEGEESSANVFKLQG